MKIYRFKKIKFTLQNYKQKYPISKQKTPERKPEGDQKVTQPNAGGLNQDELAHQLQRAETEADQFKFCLDNLSTMIEDIYFDNNELLSAHENENFET